MERERPADRQEPPPRLGVPQASYPRSEHCAACQRLTTHVRQGCTRCMGKEDNRKQGYLFAGIGAVILVIGIGWASLAGTATGPRRRRVIPGGWLTLLMVGGGGTLVFRGLRGILTGADPESEH